MSTTSPLKVAVLSSTRFGRFCIQEGILGLSEVNLVGIMTTPPEISISYSETPVRIATHARFEHLAEEAGCEIAVLSGKVTSQSYLDPISRWKPDLLIALGWYYLVPKSVRSSSPMGCLGIHASLLPKYRGGAPIPWAIINGERETGVSLFYLEDGVDQGDIVAQERFPIAHDDTCASVYARAEAASAALLRRSLPLLSRGEAPRLEQNELEATYFPQRSPEDGRIDWSLPASRIYDFIRAQTKPYPGAFTEMTGRRVTIWSAAVAECAGTVPSGRVLLDNDRVLYGASDACIEILHASVEGIGEVNGRDLGEILQGERLEVSS